MFTVSSLLTFKSNNVLSNFYPTNWYDMRRNIFTSMVLINDMIKNTLNLECTFIVCVTPHLEGLEI